MNRTNIELGTIIKLKEKKRGWILMESENFIQYHAGKLFVPDNLTIPAIPGDGIGPEVWEATKKIVACALEKAYAGKRSIDWLSVLAGEAAFKQTGSWLPIETLDFFRKFRLGIKGPLTTPVGGGIRSLNVALRKELDLYVCLRPVRWFKGIPAPVLRPENVNITIFRENTEDVYSGIEFEAGSPQAEKLMKILEENFPEEKQKIRFDEDVAIGIKPISKAGSKRLVRAAVNYALLNGKKTITLVHKGNIMKFTEGGFLNWSYEVANLEFPDQVYTARQWQETTKIKGIEAAMQEKDKALKQGEIWMNDIITDAAFQQVLLYPQEFEVIATTNLNGDYLSDALAAQVGGIGIAPGANINYESGLAIFEATHGTAPTIAGQNIANPSSLILSAEMMLRYLGWHESADLIITSLEQTIASRQLTADLAQFVPNSTKLGTAEFAGAICNNMKSIQ